MAPNIAVIWILGHGDFRVRNFASQNPVDCISSKFTIGLTKVFGRIAELILNIRKAVSFIPRPDL